MSTDRDILVTPVTSNSVKIFIRGGIEIVIHVGYKLRIKVSKDGEIIQPEYSEAMEMLEIELEETIE